MRSAGVRTRQWVRSNREVILSRVLTLWAALAAAGCAEAESDADVAVHWEHPGRCSDIGADAFWLTTAGADGERFEARCEDEGLTLPFPIGRMLTLRAELVFENEPISAPLPSPEFRVERRGVDVGFDFELEDIRKASDYRFKAVYQSDLGDVDCAVLTSQRVTLRHDPNGEQDGPVVEGAQVCGPDEVCTLADGAAGPCRGRDDEQTIPGLAWGHYRILVAGEGMGACYSNEVAISVSFSERVDTIVADQPCE